MDVKYGFFYIKEGKLAKAIWKPDSEANILLNNLQIAMY